MRILKEEHGQALIMTAIWMTILMGFVALAIDVGLLFRAKRNMQIVADAAATAAAVNNLYTGSVSSAQAAGQVAATLNGVTNGTNGAVVAINCPPASGPNTAGSCNNFFEAIVTMPNSTFFMGVISYKSSVTVAARAVAGAPIAGNACIWIMSPTASDTFHLQGSTTVDAPGCGIYVNSSSSNAVKITGNSSSFNGPDFDVVGGYSGHDTSPTGISTGVGATGPTIGTDITGPDPATACSGANTYTYNTLSWTPATSTYVHPLPAASAAGIVCFNNSSGVTISGGTTASPALLPGTLNGATVYLFENGVTIPTGATVSFGSATWNPPVGSTPGYYTNTSGAVIDLYGVGSSAGTLNQASNSVLNAYAPVLGPYNAVAIMEPPANTTQLQVQFGSNNESLDGIIYAPGAEVYLQDNGGGVTASGVVASTMNIKSSSLTIPGYSQANQNTTPFRVVTLVE